MKKKKITGLVVILYAMGVIMLIVFAYMLVSGIIYIRTYMEAYTMTISDAWQYMLQYLISGTLEYLVYGILLFAAGKIIRLTGNCCDMSLNTAEEDSCCEKKTEDQEIIGIDDAEEAAEAEPDSCTESEEIVDLTVSEDAMEETKKVIAMRNRRSRRKKH